MRIIVSDTSPIRVLDHLGLLDLLPRLFTEIVIPPKVLNELEYPTKRFKPLQLASFNWIQVRAPANQEQVKQLLQELDAGEAEAIALAIELQSEILIDEAEGREVAARLGLHFGGRDWNIAEAEDARIDWKCASVD